MIRSFKRLALPMACAALSGCLSHVAAREDSASLGILWREDFETACRDAASESRPLLVVLVAGELKDKC
jgi:hypothetical protein